MKYEITIKALPKMTNSLNVHWRVKHKHASHWKTLIARECVRLKIPAMTRAQITCVRRSAREPDADGLVSGFKHLLDGLVLAGVIPDDKPSVIGFPEYRWFYAGANKGSVSVFVEDVSLDIKSEKETTSGAVFCAEEGV